MLPVPRVEGYPASYAQAHFRTLDGTPICFWCKRVGHVKKYCWYYKPNILSRPILKHDDKPEDHTPTELPPRNKELISDNVTVTEPQKNIGQLLLALKLLAARVEQAAWYANPSQEDVDEFEKSAFQMALLDVTQKISGVSKAFQRQGESTAMSTSVPGNLVESFQSPLQPSKVQWAVRDHIDIDRDIFLEQVT